MTSGTTASMDGECKLEIWVYTQQNTAHVPKEAFGTCSVNLPPWRRMRPNLVSAPATSTGLSVNRFMRWLLTRGVYECGCDEYLYGARMDGPCLKFELSYGPACAFDEHAFNESLPGVVNPDLCPEEQAVCTAALGDPCPRCGFEMW